MLSTATLLLIVSLVHAHGDHTFDLNDAHDQNLPYAERHVRKVTEKGY